MIFASSYQHKMYIPIIIKKDEISSAIHIILYLLGDWHTQTEIIVFNSQSWKSTGEETVSRTHAHHHQVGLVQVFEEVAGVGGYWTGPRTPQQREQPTLINHPQVDCNTGLPHPSVSRVMWRLEIKAHRWHTEPLTVLRSAGVCVCACMYGCIGYYFNKKYNIMN